MKKTNTEQDQIPLLFSQETIQKRVAQMAAQISKDYSGKTPLRIVGTLKGSLVFLADLIRSIRIPVRVDFLEVSSYGNKMTSSGNIKVVKDLTHDISGENVIIAEDIIDTGDTLNHVMSMLSTKSPASLEIAALLIKPKKMELKYSVKYSGFEIDDQFVVGYGLDYKGFLRNIPYIGTITPSFIPEKYIVS